LEGKILKKTQTVTPQKASVVSFILNEQTRSNAKRLSSQKVLLYASKLWRDQSIAELIAAEASDIIRTVYQRQRIFFSGKSEKRVLAGIFYLLGIKNKAKKTQKQIALSLNTNDVTVRNSYRDWLDNFPEFFR
jgi:transcription initiation factor TFIIIB Brf1 subunit/transcription initiation factor TFIIB